MIIWLDIKFSHYNYFLLNILNHEVLLQGSLRSTDSCPCVDDLSFLSRSFGILLLSLAFLIIIILYLEVQFFCYSLSLFLWELSIWGLPCFFNSRNFIFMFSSFLKNFLYFRDFYSLDVDNRTLYTPLFEFYVIYHFRL